VESHRQETIDTTVPSPVTQVSHVDKKQSIQLCPHQSQRGVISTRDNRYNCALTSHTGMSYRQETIDTTVPLPVTQEAKLTRDNQYSCALTSRTGEKH